LDQAFEAELKKGAITKQATTVFKNLVREAFASNQDIQISLAALVSSLHPDTLHSETDMDLRELIPPNELAEGENYKPVLENYRQKYHPNLWRQSRPR
jgi:hypothetical protein